MHVTLPDNRTISSIGTGRLNTPIIQPTAHIFPDNTLRRSLISSDNFTKNNCSVLFTQDSCKITHIPSNTIINQTSKDPSTKLWPFNINSHPTAEVISNERIADKGIGHLNHRRSYHKSPSITHRNSTLDNDTQDNETDEDTDDEHIAYAAIVEHTDNTSYSDATGRFPIEDMHKSQMTKTFRTVLENSVSTPEYTSPYSKAHGSNKAERQVQT